MQSMLESSVFLWRKGHVTWYAISPANVVCTKLMSSVVLKNSTLFLFSTDIPVGYGGGREGLCL